MPERLNSTPPARGACGRRLWRRALPRLRAAGLALGALIATVVVAAAQGQPPLPTVFKSQAERERANAGLVGLITGSPGGKYMPLGTDLARLVDDREGGAMRLIVAYGYGSVQNIDDLLNLRGIDLAIVQGDVLDAFRRDPVVHQRLRQRIRYVTRLHREEIHVLARGDLTSLRALDGRRVSIGAPGSGSQMTARNLFERLGIRPELVETDERAARDDLIAGRIDAMLYVVGKGAGLFATLAGDVATRAGLAFVPLGEGETGIEPYEEAVLAAADYPSLIPQGEQVRVLAVPSVLAVFAWTPGDARYQPVARFVERFFERAPQLGATAGAQQALWCQVDLAAPVAGWERFAVAQAMLTRLAGRPGRICPGADDAADACYRRFEAAARRDGASFANPTSRAARAAYREWQGSEGRDCPAELAP